MKSKKKKGLKCFKGIFETYTRYSGVVHEEKFKKPCIRERSFIFIKHHCHNLLKYFF